MASNAAALSRARAIGFHERERERQCQSKGEQNKCLMDHLSPVGHQRRATSSPLHEPLSLSLFLDPVSRPSSLVAPCALPARDRVSGERCSVRAAARRAAVAERAPCPTHVPNLIRDKTLGTPAAAANRREEASHAFDVDVS